MSVPNTPGPARNMLGGVAGQAIPDGAEAAIGNRGQSPRQQALGALWAYYRCQNYDACRVDWSGQEIVGQVEHDMIASQASLPAGFYDNGTSLPLKFRRPTAPYYLTRLIVNRFTGLLFSAKRHPKVTVEGDPATEDFLGAVVESGRLWAQCIRLRTHGGGMGTAVMGFSLAAGRPVFEVFDPRHCTPTFADPATHELESIEIKRMFIEDIRDRETGQWVTAEFWYRRVIDMATDTVWARVPVRDGDEPAWDKWAHKTVHHDLGECPVQWIQNLPVDEDVDGDPDCHGCYDSIETIDRLAAQATRGVISNCDPTLVISSEGEMDGVSKGSDNAIKLPGGSATYLEIDGSGPEAATAMADRLEARVLRMAQCVIDQARSATTKTATEVDRDYSAMWEKADILREQYGEKGIKRLLEKALRMIRAVLAAPVVVDPETGARVRRTVVLPPRVHKDTNTGAVTYVPRALGPAPEGTLTLVWPGYTTPTPAEIGQTVDAARGAYEAGLVDRVHAAKLIAHHFDVEDVHTMLAEMDAAQAQADAYAQEVEARAMGAYEEQPVEEAAPAAESPLGEGGEGVKFFAYEIEDGIVTINEVRASKGLGPLPSGDGDLTVPQYKAKHPGTFAAAANADDGSPDGSAPPAAAQRPASRAAALALAPKPGGAASAARPPARPVAK